MHRHFFSLRIALLVIAAGIAVASLELWWRGFVVVHDPGDRLETAAIATLEGARPMRLFTQGYWVGRPVADGSIELRCRSGTVTKVGYVTPAARTTHRVTQADCAPSG